ncbi:MAG: hypothetical protein NVSMB26_02500 [Beijerinckiaceae bacterium]
MQPKPNTGPDDFLASLRPEAIAAPASGIVEVFHYGRERKDVIPLWIGEGDLPKPAFIHETATRSFAAGETFYANQRGLSELRHAIARYMARVYALADAQRLYDEDRFSIAIGGMHALQIALRMVAGNGNEALVITPACPNFKRTIAGEVDTRQLAFRLVDEAQVGVAPGSAFGASGERFIRICFARRRDDLTEAGRRLAAWLKR